MEEGLLSLKWNNHKNTFFDILKTLRDKANYTDATLAVEGKFYPVHKLVLSTCSEYFCEIFDRTPCKSPVIVLKDVRYQDLEALLDYMYLGEVNVNQNDLALLLKTAECLRIKGLAIPDEEKSSSPLPSSTNENLNKELNESLEPPSKRWKEDSSRPSSPTPRSIPSPSNITYPNSEHPIDPASVKVEIGEIQIEDSNPPTEYIHKSESEPVAFQANNFVSNQQGDVSWDDGDSSVHQDTFGEDASGNQTGGDDEDEDVDVMSYSPGSSFNSLSLTQSVESRRCQLCQVTLANGNLLRRHVEDHHFHIRKYDCCHCGKKFKRKEHRERHERIHTGEKPFVCNICHTRFTQKEHLKGHIENVHNKHRDKELKETTSTEPLDLKLDGQSSPPSLTSPSSLTALMTSSIPSMFPLSSSLSQWLPSSTSPPSILPTTSVEDKSVRALYAPVSRSTVDSPNKHVQTITINFN